MKKTILIFLLVCINNIYSQNELNFSTLKIELPKSSSDKIKPENKTKSDFYNLKYFISNDLKDETKRDDNKTKIQVFMDNKYGYLCEFLENCDDVIHYSTNKQSTPGILKIQNRYSENPKNKYDVFLYPDNETNLNELEKITKIFLETKNIEHIYFAFLNDEEPDLVLYYKFNSKGDFKFSPQSNGKYKDWVLKDFKVEYIEVMSIIQD